MIKCARIKILFVIGGLNTGGAEVMLIRLLRGIDLDKFKPYVISLTSQGELGSIVNELKIPLITLGMNRWWLPLPVFLRLLVWLYKNKPDIVHTWLYHADFFGGVAAKIAGVRAIIWGVRCADFINSNTSLSTKILLGLCIRLSSRIPKVVLYNSEKGFSFHKKIGYKERKSIVIPNGINLNEFIPSNQLKFQLRQKLGIQPNVPLIGLIARYDPLKNHAGFISAAKILHSTMPEVHFLMAGNGVELTNDALRMQIESVGLKENFHLMGSQLNIHKIISGLDLLSLSSSSEGFPNVLIEGMACGVPCVSTDVGDAEMIIGNKNWIVRVGDMQALAQKWASFFELSDSQRLLMGIKARERICENFEVAGVVKQYETVYREILSNA